MAEEIGFENGRNSNFRGLVTLTLDPAIQHTVVHHSSTCTYIPNVIQIEETFCGRTDGRTDVHFSPSNIIRSTFGSRPKNVIFFILFVYVTMCPPLALHCTYFICSCHIIAYLCLGAWNLHHFTFMPSFTSWWSWASSCACPPMPDACSNIKQIIAELVQYT